MPRRMDSLSGRINQALDRYAWILAREGPRIRALFNDAQWAGILEYARRWREMDAAELPAFVRVCIGVQGLRMSDADLVLLADLAEGDL